MEALVCGSCFNSPGELFAQYASPVVAMALFQSGGKFMRHMRAHIYIRSCISVSEVGGKEACYWGPNRLPASVRAHTERLDYRSRLSLKRHELLLDDAASVCVAAEIG